jgi:glutathione S-transferase
MGYRLVIGNKNTSSWSMRPWLAMRQAGIALEEVNVNLRAPDKKAQILRHSPSGKVPALVVDDPAAGGFLVWDTLAILEYLAETHPRARLWPEQAGARAHARAVSAEMHSGFQQLREHCPMDLLARTPRDELAEPVAADVRRVVAIWRGCRGWFGAGGPYLFGAFTAADAMYAPVASRFRTYISNLGAYGDDGTAAAYIAAIFALPAMQAWEAGAKAELAAAGSNP